MGVLKLTCAAGLALTLAACGEEKKQAAPSEAAPATLAAGLYEVSGEVVQLASTDNTSPSTKLKQGDKLSTRACVSADGKPEPELLAENGDKCTVKSSYVRNGRMSAEMNCTRDGKSGSVMPAMNGSFSKDAFEGNITTLTYFTDDGDYRMTRKITARRVGDCPVGEPAAKTG